MSDANRIEKQAAAWRVRQDRPDWSAQDQAQLDAWLEESTAHRVAWLRMGYGWQRVDRLAVLRRPVAEAPRLSQRLRRRLSLAMAASVVAALALGFFGVSYWQALGTHSFVTAVGERQTVPLQDGSQVELNTDTRLRAAVDESARTVWLDRGEAYFDVAHDASRPFVVYAGDRRVEVLGTRFSVRSEGRRVEVVVAEGKVKVAAARAGDTAPPAMVVRGDRVISESGSMLVASDAARVDNALAWRRGVLVFDKISLAQAAAEFNRYNSRKLVIVDDAVAGMRISGSFEADNVEAFARLLQRAFGLDLQEEGMQISVAE